MDESQVISLEIPSPVLDALSALESQGFESWIVGGCVRDALLERPLHDFDIATAAPWKTSEKILKQAGFKIHRTGIAHGTITAVQDDLALEITTFRIDGTYSDGRHPDSVKPAQSIYEDVLRRDFTINGLAYHPDRGILDAVGGLADIEMKRIRAIGDPDKRFEEDGLRILRGLRFVSELGFTLEEQTLQAMKCYKMKLNAVSAERIVHELDRLLLGDFVHEALMVSIDILGSVMPEIVACKGFAQHTPYHIYDVWEHTTWVVQQVPPTRLARWAAFFHDVGKPGAFYIDGDRGHFYEHAKLSMIIAQEIMERLRFAPSFTQQILMLIRVHDHQILATPRGVKRMLFKLKGNTELFETLMTLKRADCLSQSPLSKERLALCDQIDAIYQNLLIQEEAFSLKQLALKGTDILNLGVTPGPTVGALLCQALDAVIDERVPNDRTALISYIEDKIKDNL